MPRRILTSRVIPSPIRVLGGDFTISYDEYDNKLNGNSGIVDANQRCIYVDDGIDLVSIKEVILHELIHLADQAASTAEENLTEQQVTRVSVILFTILRDNPALTTWLFLSNENTPPWEECCGCEGCHED